MRNIKDHIYAFSLLLMLVVPLSAQTVTLTDSDIKAFPTADGFGKYTTGGKGGSVVFVTNLNNSGSGSLRNALENLSGPRTIIFRVAGYIDLTSYIYINDGDVTIAGETAPGDGITLRGYGFQIQDGNVIIRHIRTRTGSEYNDIKGFRIASFANNYTIENIIIDHCSSSWGTDENMAFTMYGTNSKIQNVTVQKSILAENLGSGAVLVMNDFSKASFINNYLANNFDRQFHPSTCGASFEVVNNVIYNYVRGTEITYEGYVDVIGNIYKSGSNVTPTGYPMTYQTNATNCPSGNPANGSVYQTDNVKINNVLSMTNGTWTTYDNGSRVITDSPYTPYSSSMVADSVLADVGAFPHDVVDTRLIGYYTSNGGGLIGHESEVGGYPTLSSGTPYTDSDGDGLSDAYETANGGSISPSTRPASAVISDSRTVNQSGVTDYATEGYTYLDIFIADLAGDWDSFESDGGDPEPEPFPIPQSKLTKKRFTKIGL
tara:strand:- start:3383 stop:4849 length:1467 start_codon:yes stop_codon:yes gene_type:complete